MRKLSILKHKIIRAYHNPKNMENTAVKALNKLSDSDFEKLLKEVESYSKVGPTIEEYKEFLNRTPKI